MTAATCTGNYAERLRSFLIAGRSSFVPAVFFRKERWRKKKDSKAENKQSFATIPLISPYHAFHHRDFQYQFSVLVLLLMSRILMLMELITYGVVLFFISVCTP